MKDAVDGLVSLTPVLIQLWTNGRPVSTGTIVPFRAASLRLLALVSSQNEGGDPITLRIRAEVCPFTGVSNVSQEEVAGDKLAAVTQLMSLASHVNPTNHLFWKEESISSPATHWAQNVVGDACKITPTISREGGDGALAQVLRLAGLAAAGMSFMPERDDIEDTFVALAPPVMHESLDAATGVLFFAGRAELPGSEEFQLLQASACKEKTETVSPLTEAAWT